MNDRTNGGGLGRTPLLPAALTGHECHAPCSPSTPSRLLQTDKSRGVRAMHQTAQSTKGFFQLATIRRTQGQRRAIYSTHHLLQQLPGDTSHSACTRSVAKSMLSDPLARCDPFRRLSQAETEPSLHMPSTGRLGAASEDTGADLGSMPVRGARKSQQMRHLAKIRNSGPPRGMDGIPCDTRLVLFKRSSTPQAPAARPRCRLGRWAANYRAANYRGGQGIRRALTKTQNDRALLNPLSVSVLSRLPPASVQLPQHKCGNPHRRSQKPTGKPRGMNINIFVPLSSRPLSPALLPASLQR